MLMHTIPLQCIILCGFFLISSDCQDPPTPSVETIRVLVVLVQWSNHASRTMPTKDDISQLWNGPGNTTLVPGESVKDWMTSNSYGKIQVQADVADWYPMEATEAEASFGNMGNSPSGSSGLAGILQPALENTGFNLTDYADANGDLIGVIFVHSGYSAEQGGVDPDGANYLDRIASKSWSTNKRIQGVRFQTFATVSAIKGTSQGIQMAGIGHHIHEWMHARFGLHDLNDLGGRYNNSTVATGGIGAFGIMSFPEGPGYNEAFPGNLNPYYKMKIGALEPIDILNDGIYRFNASSSLEPIVYRIQAPYPTGEYLLIENRQPILSDKNLWAPGGIVIYHIDELADGNKVRGGPFVEGWPGNGAHYQVAVLQADGKYELEKAVNLGDANDFWKAGDVLGPGNGELVATLAGTYPNTDSYQGGNIAVTSLSIANFTDEGGGEWTFEVVDIVSRIKTPPLFVIEPTRCPTYSADFFPGPDFECNCQSDCDPTNDRHLFCNCAEGDACCAMSNTPSETPGEPSSLPSFLPTLQPSISPSTIPSDLPSAVPSTQPSGLPSTVPTVAPVTPVPAVSQGALAAQDEPPNIIGMAAIGLVILGVLGYIGYLQWQKKKKDEENDKKSKENKKKPPPPEPEEDPKDEEDEEEPESKPLKKEKSFKDEDSDSDSDSD